MKCILKSSLLVTAALALVVSVALAAQMLSIQVRSGQLRDKPGYLSKVISKLSYGDRVEMLSEKNDWRKVKSPSGAAGWMHVSALSEQEIILKPTNKDVEAAAESDELALAGKGFNKQVEDKYKSEQKLDYATVNQMEKLTVSPNTIQKFMKDGGLAGEVK
ncbi:SH3 domain-containing protein [Pseudodesulfovibrio sediminis]|uniref:SH3b domain-containing protein n=1 Tax=Pseudodesulfovibrio sediminis TaxID=2810563 RepID=A0ABM7P5B7_9BACT|nr:SH3 domain-containing protein [Pseudodesulfovibrio sediminis]BCS87992.1 hypothetical protein PSDVSF_12340 [Pseudodesulfovibrio sediminis]